MASRKLHQERLESLDGLRGVAALSVFMWHSADVFWPTLIGSQLSTGNQQQLTGAWDRIARLPIGILFNGPLAVSVFFCLSAFVLTRAVLRSQSGTLLVLLRLPRLLPLVACGSLLAFAILGTGMHYLDRLAEANGVTNSRVFVDGMLPPSFADCAYQIFVAVWHRPAANELYDRVLWTIGTEFQGSVVTIALATCLLGVQSKVWSTMIVLFTGTSLMGLDFFYFAGGYGLAIATVESSEVSATTRKPRSQGGYALQLIGFGIVIVGGAIHPSFASRSWLNINPASYVPVEPARLVTHLAIALVLIKAAISRNWFARTLSSPGVQYLGFISFAFYVVHQPLLYSIGGYVCLSWMTSLGYAPAALAGVCATLVASVVLADALTRLVDRPLYSAFKYWARRPCIEQIPVNQSSLDEDQCNVIELLPNQNYMGKRTA